MTQSTTTSRLSRLTMRSRTFVASHPYALGVVAVTILAVAILGSFYIYRVLSGLPSRDALRSLEETVEGTTVFDVHDRPIFSFPTQYRIEVPIEQISPNLKRAVVAVEDARFYDHHGVDGIRIIGAVLTDLRERRKAEGASTITQQVARMGFLSRDKTFRRKLREAVLAQRIEKIYSKEQILELYLNKAYFGDGLYGAEAASRGYFGKSASQLSYAEAALLAGVLKAPSTGNPVANLTHATERRNLVLKLMLEHDMIAKPDYDGAVAAPVLLRDTLRGEVPSGVHFKELVRRDLLERFGKDKLYRGQLKVYATIDPEMQKAAEVALTQSLRDIEARTVKASRARKGAPTPLPRPAESGENRLQGALIALDAASGEVRAIVGGRDTQSVGLNRALQTRRQPGSAFKPFVYAAALETGYSPATLIENLNMPIDTYQGAWLPEDEHSVAPSMTMRTALRTSSNRAAVRMLETVGIDRTVSYAKRLGVGTVPSVPSLALGSGEVTLAAMTAAYGVFAQSGVLRDPVFIKRVEDQDGAILYEADAKPRRVLSPNTAFLMATMLADVIDAGTANRARALGFKLPAGGKTGTTNDFADAWFVGFTPRLVAGVWVGFDQPRTIVKNGFAGLLAVPIWARFMTAATKGDRAQWLEPPSDVAPVQVCRVSGALPVPGCSNAAIIGPSGAVTYKSMLYTDYFVRGMEPQHTCATHAFQYLPYSEPTFAEAAFDDLGEALGVDPSVTQAVEGPVPMTPLYAPPVPIRRLPDLPAARPESPPLTEPEAVTGSQFKPEALPKPEIPTPPAPESALPPAAGPELPPTPPQP